MTTKNKTKITRAAKGAAVVAAKRKANTMSTEIRAVELHRIIPMPNNRHVAKKSEKMRELVTSVKAHAGNLVPGIARPHPSQPDCVELISGNRRLWACGECGVATMNLIVSDFTDAEAVTCRVTENRGREDLTPIEEGRDVADMLRVHGTLKAVADKMRVSEKWVARRAKLASLIPAWVALAESEDVLAGIAQLELVAALPEETQTRLFELMKANTWALRPDRLAEFKRQVAEHTHILSAAPWKLDDETLVPKAGACSECPKRSGCAPELFDPDTFAEVHTRGKQAADDRCLDGACWADKLAAHLKREEDKLTKKHGPVLRVCELTRFEPGADEAKAAGALLAGEFREVKKSTPGAKPALVTAGDGTGTMIYVVMGEAGTGDGAAVEKPKGDTLDDKRAGLERRRWARVAEQVRQTVEVCEVPDVCNAGIVDEATASFALGGLVMAFGTRQSVTSLFEMEQTEAVKSRFDLATWLSGHSWKKIGVWMFAQLKPEILASITVAGAKLVDDAFVAHVRGAAKLVGLDCDKLKAATDDEIPEPKSWAKLGEEKI